MGHKTNRLAILKDSRYYGDSPSKLLDGALLEQRYRQGWLNLYRERLQSGDISDATAKAMQQAKERMQHVYERIWEEIAATFGAEIESGSAGSWIRQRSTASELPESKHDRFTLFLDVQKRSY